LFFGDKYYLYLISYIRGNKRIYKALSPSTFSSSNFIVVDTEGSHILSEIAIIDDQGQLIYEAYTQTADSKPKLHSKPLAQILQDFFAIACTPQPKIIVCHFAEHDRQILKNSCRQAGITWRELTFVCTVERSQRLTVEVNSGRY
jgi:hypothetical protein